MKKIAIATGGTGGHIYPALALADLWKKKEPDTEIVFFGNDNRMEASLIPDRGYAFVPLHASGLTGGLTQKIRAASLMAKAVWQARTALKKKKPDLVIGFGGYVSAPAVLAARSLGIPVMIHEQNSIVGKANHLAASAASAIVTCYDKAQEALSSRNARQLGNPRATVAAGAVRDEEYFRSLGLDPAKKTILIVMGSLGSSSVNALMKEALASLDPDLQVLYVCGKDNEQDLHLFDDYPNVHTVPYVDTMRLYKMLDGMICRAGATTLAELTALGIPSILIPSPYVAENHQYYNARMLSDQGAAILIEEKDLNAKSLSKAARELFENEETRRKTAAAARRLGTPNAAWDMIDWADQLIRTGK